MQTLEAVVHLSPSEIQGRIQECFIEGVQTLVQKGLLNFFVANYFTPSHQSWLYVT